MKKKNRGSWESKKHRDYKYRDKKRGNEYAFSLEQSSALFRLPCFYCTKPMAKGLDRLDNNLGYESENVIPCCQNCNTILGTLPKEAKMEMREALRSIYEKNLLEGWTPIYMVPVKEKTPPEAHKDEHKENPAEEKKIDVPPPSSLKIFSSSYSEPKTPFVMNGFPEKYIQSPMLESVFASGTFADKRGTFAEILPARPNLSYINATCVIGEQEIEKLLEEGRAIRKEIEEKQRKLRWTKCLYCNHWVDSCICKAV